MPICMQYSSPCIWYCVLEHLTRPCLWPCAHARGQVGAFMYAPANHDRNDEPSLYCARGGTVLPPAEWFRSLTRWYDARRPTGRSRKLRAWHHRLLPTARSTIGRPRASGILALLVVAEASTCSDRQAKDGWPMDQSQESVSSTALTTWPCDLYASTKTNPHESLIEPEDRWDN
jgi:hypothetical protein